MKSVWSGTLGGDVHLSKEELPHIVRNCLSRSQLKDLILLQRSNPTYDFVKLLALFAILEEDCKYPSMLEKHGLHPSERISPTEKTQFSCMERSELERLVLSFI